MKNYEDSADCPLLRNERHRAMMKPFRLQLTRLIDISPSYWTIYRLFEIILEYKLSIYWNSNPKL